MLPAFFKTEIHMTQESIARHKYSVGDAQTFVVLICTVVYSSHSSYVWFSESSLHETKLNKYWSQSQD